MLQAKYRKIFEQLSHDIAGGQYQPGQKFPSEAALVKRFGASRITVGHALRDLQQSGMIDRIAGSGTYVRDVAGHTREAPVFGLIIPNLGETEIFEPICRGIAAAPGARNHALLWLHAESGAGAGRKEEEALQLARQCIARRVSGVFFAPLEMSANSTAVNRRVMKLLKEAGIPIVLLDRRPDEFAPRDHCDMVGIDNRHAGYLVTRHLLQLGARRIAFAAYRGQASTVKARIEGYREAMADAQRVEAPVLYLSPDEPSTGEIFDAFVCANDRIAGRLMHALLARGVRIPQDVRIVGMDDVNYASLLPVPLTTIHQPCRDLGETALRLMLDRLDHPQMPARDVLLDCSLVIRESCGYVPAPTIIS